MVTETRIETQAPTQTDHETEQETRKRLEQWQAMAANLQGGFTQMPNAVRQDPTLSTSAKLVYEHLLGYMWDKEWCWPGQQRIAQELGISRRTVIRACNELYQRGYVEVWRRGLGKTNVYFINPLSFVHLSGITLTQITLQRPADTPLASDSPLAPLYGLTFYANDASLSSSVEKCQNVTSGSARMSLPEVPECHTMQTKENQTKAIEKDSKFSTDHKERVLGGTQPNAGTGHSNQSQERRTQGRKEQQKQKEQEEQKATRPNPQPSNQDQSAALPNTQPISRAQKQSAQAANAISQATGIPAEHMQELGIAAPQPRRRPIPSFIADIMRDYSRDLGDAASSIKSNITRASKYYYLMYDYCPDDDFRYAPEEYFTRLLYVCKEEALTCTNIKYKTGNRFNRIPAFFGCLENRLGLTPEEREFVRTDAPLYYPEQ